MNIFTRSMFSRIRTVLRASFFFCKTLPHVWKLLAHNKIDFRPGTVLWKEFGNEYAEHAVLQGWTFFRKNTFRQQKRVAHSTKSSLPLMAALKETPKVIASLKPTPTPQTCPLHSQRYLKSSGTSLSHQVQYQYFNNNNLTIQHIYNNKN